jgi:hypothetical protein
MQNWMTINKTANQIEPVLQGTWQHFSHIWEKIHPWAPVRPPADSFIFLSHFF